MASAAAHPMHGQWTSQSTPTGPRAALEDPAPTYVFIKKKKKAVSVHSPSVFGAGDHVSTLVAMALSEFSMKKKKILRSSCRATNAHKTPPRRRSASVQNPQCDGNRNRDTAALAEEYAQNSKTII